MKNKKGILISFEGGEGAGKTTQVAILKKKLEEIGKEVICVREPGGTKISEQIREITHNIKNTEMSFITEVFLFQAARAQVYKELVIPALEKGKVVLADRSSDSSVVYQGIVRGFGRKLIDNLNKISTQKTCPNLTFFLDVPTKLGFERVKKSGKLDRMESEKEDFYEKVRQGYLELVKENKGKRWIRIDASKNLEEVTEEIWKKIKEKI